MVTLSPEAQKALAKTNSLYGRLSSRRSEIEEMERYFRGDQKLAYASDEWRRVHQGRYKNFSDNWCGVVGRAPGERTELFGIRLGNDSDPLSPDEKRLWDDWEINDGPAQSSQGWLMSTIAKRSAALVWGDDNDEPILTWEHPAQTIVERDPATRRRRYGLKAWIDGDRECATLYTPDEVWKFQRSRTAATVTDGRTESGLYVVGGSFTPGDTNGWEPRQDDGDDTWPIENPLGELPLVDFPNRPVLGGEPLSDIAGTMSMQDAVNMLWAYLFVAADHASMPARVVTGQEPPKIPILDSNGQKIGEQPIDIEALTKGRMLWLTGQNTKVDQWDAAKLDVFTDVIQIAVKHVAAQTATPINLIHGELGNVNGETVQALAEPLVSKVREGHKFYRTPVREVFRLMALVRGNTGVADKCRTAVVQWKDPEQHTSSQISDAALKDKQIGWPFAAILEKRYGLSQPEIARVMEMRNAEATDPIAASLMRGLTPDRDQPPTGLSDDAQGV